MCNSRGTVCRAVLTIMWTITPRAPQGLRDKGRRSRKWPEEKDGVAREERMVIGCPECGGGGRGEEVAELEISLAGLTRGVDRGSWTQTWEQMQAAV